MTQSLTADRNFEFAGRADRSDAILAARKHSRRVAHLKRGIIVGSTLGIGLLAAVAIFDPFSSVPANVSIAAASLSGTKITMELPKLNGFRKDGKPYQVRARSGVQDVRSPKIIELNEVEARVQVEENNSVNVIAPAGVFDSGTDSMKLRTVRQGEEITLKSTSGFVVLLKSADVNLKSGSLVSNDPVSVQMPNGTITADTVNVGESGKNIVFNGNVRSLFKSRESESEVGTE